MLVADIGGTNARFALADLATGELLVQQDYATAEAESALALVRQAAIDLAGQLPGRTHPQAAALAIAGPVNDGRGKLTNGELVFAAAELAAELGYPVRVLNDFEAVAAAVDDSIAVLPVGPLEQSIEGVRGVVGPGTGLGMGYLVPDAHAPTGYRVFASEGGNVDFAPVNQLEQEVLAIVREQLPTVSTEALCSGRGLPTLYAAVCRLWGATPELTTAAEIAEKGVAASDPVCHHTLTMFCGMLGTAAGNFALSIGARGGIYLAGGILPRIQAFFLASDFRDRFDDRGPMRAFNKQIPTFLITESAPGLRGAAKQARALLQERSQPGSVAGLQSPARRPD